MKDPRIFLGHIADSIAKIRAYTDEGRLAFLADSKTQDAVIRNLEIIGEAVKSLPESTRSAEPSIPWKAIAGTRDKLIHAYFGVGDGRQTGRSSRGMPSARSAITLRMISEAPPATV